MRSGLNSVSAERSFQTIAVQDLLVDVFDTRMSIGSFYRDTEGHSLRIGSKLQHVQRFTQVNTLKLEFYPEGE